MIVEKRMKVPAGKLLILKAQVEDGAIIAVHLEGDFFFHPEDKLRIVEEALPAMSKDEMDDIVKKLDSIVTVNGLSLIGLTTQAIASLLAQVFAELEESEEER